MCNAHGGPHPHDPGFYHTLCGRFSWGGSSKRSHPGQAHSATVDPNISVPQRCRHLIGLKVPSFPSRTASQPPHHLYSQRTGPPRQRRFDSAGVEAARHRLAQASGMPKAALVRHRPRQAAAASLEACLRRSLSDLAGFLECTASSTPCVYAAAACGRHADVHRSGELCSFIMLLMALGTARWVCSTEPWPLAAAEHTQASDWSVCAWRTGRISRFGPNIEYQCVSVTSRYEVMACLDCT